MTHPMFKQYRSAGGERLVWFAVVWGDEAASKRAWEAAMQIADNTHVWRVQTPLHGPPFRWVVIGMAGERHRRGLLDALAKMDAEGGYAEWLPEEGFLEALAMRRARMIAERTLEGDFGLKSIRRPRTLDRAGRMTDYDPDAA